MKGLVVISAGFSETGEEGAALEQELLDVVRVAGMRMVGPNCMGMLNTDPAVSLDADVRPHLPAAGQRGDVQPERCARASPSSTTPDQLDIGISTFVSVGNKADVVAPTTCSSTGRATRPPT